ncbi:MAG: 3-deoxy-manno-octulosonate cytidylyltransferase [Flavobacteriia bacterium]|nr:3-deoxy-manno-octulosonate cytidylyltransferase [Flavobacteriia bacterium]
MNILGVIPARFASTRFPGKPLLDLKGKTMIQRVYEGCLASKSINKLVVATDDEQIFNEVKRFGGEVMMTSFSHQSGTERCNEVAQQFPDYNVVINIQGDEPLVNHKQLDELLQCFNDPNIQIATSAIKENNLDFIDNPNRIKIVLNSKNEALYFSRCGIPYSQQEETNYPYLRHIGLYAYQSEVLKHLCSLPPCLLEKKESLEQLRWLYYGYTIKVVETDIESPNIDVPEDVEQVLKLL